MQNRSASLLFVVGKRGLLGLYVLLLIAIWGLLILFWIEENNVYVEVEYFLVCMCGVTFVGIRNVKSLKWSGTKAISEYLSKNSSFKSFSFSPLWPLSIEQNRVLFMRPIDANAKMIVLPFHTGCSFATKNWMTLALKNYLLNLPINTIQYLTLDTPSFGQCHWA